MSTRINSQASFGGPYTQGSYRYANRSNVDLNQTATFVPPAYLEGNPAKSVHKLYKAPQIDPNQEEEEVKKLLGPISAHCEMRIQYFYQMLCLVFGSQMTFKSLPAQGQVGMKNGHSDGQLAEAHSSTIPSLLCWKSEQEEAAFGAEPVDLCPLLFAKDSYFYRSWNATVKLPVFVNNADSLIDFTTTHQFLGNRNFRHYSTELLNQAAKGAINPQVGLANFLHRFLQVIRTLNQDQKNPVMNCYASVAQYYLDFIKDPANIAKLTFEKGPQLPYDQIQKEMWQRMTDDISAHRIVARIQKEALKSIEGNVNNKEYLAPGILLRLFPGSMALHVTAQQQILKLKIRERTPLQLSYASQLASDPKIIALAKQYFDRFNDIETLSEMLIKSVKNQWKFYNCFKETAEQILERSPQQPEVLFWSTIPLVYAQLNSTNESQAIRRFLCINDSWFSQLTENGGQIQKYIAASCQNQKIIKLARQLIENLRKKDPQEEINMEICEEDLTVFRDLKKDFRDWSKNRPENSLSD